MAYPTKNTDTPTFGSKNSSSFTVTDENSINLTWAQDIKTWVAETRTWAQTYNAVWSYNTKN